VRADLLDAHLYIVSSWTLKVPPAEKRDVTRQFLIVLRKILICRFQKIFQMTITYTQQQQQHHQIQFINIHKSYSYIHINI
jgi:hypothetical protein